MTEPADTEFESSADAYAIKLENFEGPLDLLIHLIKQNEVNIYDIPIALITSQYLEYLDLMQELDLDVAGEFVVMAATLIHIKSRMLLPRPDPEQEDPEEDPREAAGAAPDRPPAVQGCCRAAARVRDAARGAVAQARRAYRGRIAGEEYEPELEVDLFSLLTAFRAVLERAAKRPHVDAARASRCRSRTGSPSCWRRLSETEACGFEDLFDDVWSKGDLIVTFLALLEMIRLRIVRVFQAGRSASSASTSARRRQTPRLRVGAAERV